MKPKFSPYLESVNVWYCFVCSSSPEFSISRALIEKDGCSGADGRDYATKTEGNKDGIDESFFLAAETARIG